MLGLSFLTVVDVEGNSFQVILLNILQEHLVVAFIVIVIYVFDVIKELFAQNVLIPLQHKYRRVVCEIGMYLNRFYGLFMHF